VLIVKNEYLSVQFLNKHPGVVNSPEYKLGIGWRLGDAAGHNGGWWVRHRKGTKIGRAAVDVGFFFDFKDHKKGSLSIECSMGRCNPNPICQYGD
jgi:hypothetical protein